jgi:hypothetical protein
MPFGIAVVPYALQKTDHATEEYHRASSNEIAMVEVGGSAGVCHGGVLVDCDDPDAG